MGNEGSTNCHISSSESKFGGSTFSSDRINCDYKINDRFSAGVYGSNDSQAGGPTKGGEGYGGGINFGFKFGWMFLIKMFK